MKTLIIEVLVYSGVLVALLSSWLMLRMKDEYQMMHFMAPPASLSVVLITRPASLPTSAPTNPW